MKYTDPTGEAIAVIPFIAPTVIAGAKAIGAWLASLFVVGAAATAVGVTLDVAIADGKNQIWRVTNMFKILLKEKYDIQSFYLKDSFEVLLSSPQGIKRLNFGDRIVYTKFYEEEVTNRIKFPYYNLLGENIRTTTLLQEIDSQLIKQIESDTGSFYSAEELKHYVIIAENYIMEIVSYDEVQFY